MFFWRNGNIVPYARHGSFYYNHCFISFSLRLACFQGGEESNSVEQLDISTAANQFVLDSKKAFAYAAIIDKDYTRM